MRIPHLEQTGFIYFFREADNGAIKIGHAKGKTQAILRLSQVQIGNPRVIEYLGLVPGTMADEQALHATFKTDHIRGEWFRPSASLLAHIQTKARA